MPYEPESFHKYIWLHIRVPIGIESPRFEVAHGEIKDTEQPPIPLNFGPTGQA